MAGLSGRVVGVSRDATHRFSKANEPHIVLVAGIGVLGDAHSGRTVQHRSRAARDPTLPNLRQVHLIHAELHDELSERGFHIRPGEMGENITTSGVDLLGLPTDSRLRIGAEAVVTISGLRNPCVQLNGLAAGLMKAVLDRDRRGRLVRKAGVMGIVVTGGTVRPDDPIVVEPAAPPYRPLEPV